MFKKIAVVFLSLLLLFSVAGCGKKTGTQEEQEVILQTEPIIRLDCFSEVGLITDLAEAPGNRLAILHETLPADGAQDGETVSRLLLVDLKENRLEQNAEDPGITVILGFTENGEMIGMDYTAHILKIFDSSFALSREVELPDPRSMKFSAEDQCVYCFCGETLCRVGLDGEKKELATLPGVSNLEGYDAKNGVFLFQDGNLTDQSTWQIDYTAYSIRDKEILYTLGATTTVCFSERGAWFTSEIGDPETAEQRTAYIRDCDPATGKTRKAYRLPENGYLHEFSQAGYGLWNKYLYDMNDKPVYRMLDLKNGRSTELKVGEEKDEIAKGEFVNGGRNYACITNDNDFSLNLYLIAPALLTYDETLEEGSEEAWQNTTEDAPAVSDALAEERQTADRLEEQYAVRILLGEPCKYGENIFAYQLAATDGGNSRQKADLRESLAILEKVLSLYPDGFFKTFRNYRDKAGLRFFLAADLTNPNGDFTPVGLSSYMEGWYNIVLNVKAITATTMHHEIWHSVESRILQADGTLLSDEEWDKLNPPDFEYLHDYDTYSEQNGILPLTLLSGSKNAYFIDLYSTVTVQEDRATLIETILSENYDPAFYGEPDPLTMIRNRPHLAAKLAFLENPVKQVFGSVYWEGIVAKAKYKS